MHDQLRPALCAAFVIVAAALAVQAPVTAAPRVVAVAAPAAKPGPAPTDRFIVAFKDDALEKRNPVARQHLLDALGRRLGVRVSHGRGLANGADVIRTHRKLDAHEAKKLLLALYNDPRVAYVEVDRVHVPRGFPEDPLQPQQPQLFRDLGGHGFDFAWERGTGSGVIVAVVDTGIVGHEDLDANVVAGYDFISDPTSALDGDGRDADPTDRDFQCNEVAGSEYHGTAVAGIIAAVGDNEIGMTGAAYEATIQPVRALGACGGTTSDIADAIRWAAGGAVAGAPANATPAQVINLSFATNGSCGQTLQSAIDTANAAGAVVVAATGDDDGEDVALLAPASCAGVILVRDGRAENVAYGPLDENDLVDVTATTRGMPFNRDHDDAATYGLLAPSDTGFPPAQSSYARRAGSSFSTALASATVAIMQSVRPHAPADVEALLRATADPVPLPWGGRTFGAGMLDADAASLAASTPTLVARGEHYHHEADANSTAEVVVTLSKPVTTPVSFVAATRAGTANAGEDFVALPPTAFTIAPGQTSKVIPVTLIGDDTVEGRERFHVDVSEVVGAADKTSPVDLVIEDDEAQPLNAATYSFPVEVDSPDGASRLLYMDIPAGSYWAMASVRALAGDPDIYVRREAVPTTTEYDCAATGTGVTGTCYADAPEGAAGGRYYVLVHSVSGAYRAEVQGNWDERHDVVVSDAWQAEGTNRMTFTVSRTTPGTTAMSADVYVQAGTAGFDDIQGVVGGGSVYFGVGQTTHTVEVELVDDALVEGNESFSLVVSTFDGADTYSGTGTIHDNDGPTLILGHGEAIETDADQVVPVIVELTQPVAGPVTFTFATADGTATAGSDYDAIGPVTGTIPAGATQATFDITVHGDDINEGEEAFHVTISDATGASIQVPEAEVLIEEDDLPAMSIGDVAISEGDAGLKVASFTVQLSHASPYPVHYDIGVLEDGTADPLTDYRTQFIDEVIPAGMLAKTFNVAIEGDNTIEPDETFFVEVESEQALVVDAIAQGTILDDDRPVLSIGDVRVAEGNVGTKTAVFTVSLHKAGPQAVGFNIGTTGAGTATAGVDYVARSLTGLQFAPGTTSRTFAVTLNGDTTPEANETFVVAVTGITNARVGDASALGTIVNDDDLPALSIGDVAIVEGNSGTKSAVFTATLNHPTPAAVSFNIATTGAGTATAGSDYTPLASTPVTIPAGQLAKTINVAIHGDDAIEANETFVVSASGVTAATVADGSALGTITNDDAPTLSIADVTVTEGNTGTKFATFTATLSRTSPFPVSFNAATSGAGTATAGVDYTAMSLNGLTVPAGQLTKVFNVTIHGDTAIENNETFVVLLSNVINARLADGNALGTIGNDDKPVLTIADVALTEGNSGTKNAVFTVSISQQAPYPVTFNIATTGAGTATAGVDYVAKSLNGLQIAAGQTSKTVAVTLNGDTTVEPNETYVVSVSGVTGANVGDGAALGTITNDD